MKNIDLKQTQRLNQVEEAVRQGRVVWAAEELRKCDTSTFDRFNVARYEILRAETANFMGDYSCDELDHCETVFREAGDPMLLAKTIHLKGCRLILLGKPALAIEPLTESYEIYRHENNSRGACLLINRLAQAYLILGETDLAIASLRKCRQIAEGGAHDDLATIAVINLAYLLSSKGYIQDSIIEYSSVCEKIVRKVDRDAVVCHMMAALPHALTGDYSTARKCLARSRRISGDYLREQAICFENEGFVNILSGDYKAAAVSLQAGLDIALEIAPESALVSQIKRLFGDLYWEIRKPEIAEKYASEALVVAEKIDQKVEIAACYRVLAQVEAEREKTDRAHELFGKAIDLFSQIGSQYELAVTRYMAACSGIYSHVEKVAMLYLAKEYFESEKIEPYLKKVGDELARCEGPESLPASPPAKSSSSLTIITSNLRMKQILDLARHVAPLPSSVLLTGETGTGKDLIARYIHEQSGRTGDFVSVNAAAIPDAMIESELFGYRRGSFTGAERDRVGLFEQAESGTFYLNEIADATPSFQAKLLEVLDNSEIRRLGENKSRKVKFRLVAATNHDLKKRVKENLFRLDLYHRLNQVAIHLPPLADRSDDIAALTAYFVKGQLAVECRNGRRAEIARLGAALACHPWPGNIRQLQATLNSLAVNCRGDLTLMADEAIRLADESEEDLLLRILGHTDWNRSKAAQILGLTEGAIRKRIAKYGLVKEQA